MTSASPCPRSDEAGQKLNLRRKSNHFFHDKPNPIKVFEYLMGCVFMMLKPVCQYLFSYSYFLILALHQNALYMYSSSMKSTKQEIQELKYLLNPLV